MPLTAFTSLATYTAVLAESLAAIGLSSLAPSLLATIGKLAKCAVEEDDGTLRAAAQAQVDNLIRGLGKLAGPTREGDVGVVARQRVPRRLDDPADRVEGDRPAPAVAKHAPPPVGADRDVVGARRGVAAVWQAHRPPVVALWVVGHR